MTRARLVLQAISGAFDALDHHPQLFSKYAVEGRSAASLARALARYRTASRKPPGRDDDYNGDREAERVDRAFEETEARRREERFKKRKRSFDAERKGVRLEMTSLELHRLLVERVATISTVSAQRLDSSKGSQHPSVNLAANKRGAQQLSDDPRFRESEHVIRSRLLRLHELLDEAEGLGPVEAKTMDSGEKDKRIISEGEGLSPSAVVALLGTDIAGSASTVRRVRKQAGRSMVDGRRLEQDAVSQTTPGQVRRVVIEP